MTVKTTQLQIRVTPDQKRRLKDAAHRAGQDMSGYVLARALPAASEPFSKLLVELREDANRRFALAALNDLLTALAPMEFGVAVAEADLRFLDAYLQNYVAAMVEQAAHQKGVTAPKWASEVEPLSAPRFAAPLRKLRLHLLRSAPVPFRRRNIFVDASIGDRV